MKNESAGMGWFALDIHCILMSYWKAYYHFH